MYGELAGCVANTFVHEVTTEMNDRNNAGVLVVAVETAGEREDTGLPLLGFWRQWDEEKKHDENV